MRLIRFPGLVIAFDALIFNQGKFHYKKGCSIGKNTIINIPANGVFELGTGCYIGRYVEIGVSNKFIIGDNTTIQDRGILLGDLTIGSNCIIAPNFYVSSGRHYFDIFSSWLIRDQDQYVSLHDNFSKKHSKPVIIEDDCWIGINVVVMSGITIGRGAIIGANSVVTKDVLPYTIVVGSPAKIIRNRIDFIPPNKISYNSMDHIPYFYSGFDVSQSAMNKYGKEELGILVNNRICAVYLNAIDAKKLHLRIKSLITKDVKISFQEQIGETKVGTYHEIIFIINNVTLTDKEKFVFQVHSETEKDILIQEIWVS